MKPLSLGRGVGLGLRKRNSTYNTNAQTGRSTRGHWWDLLAALAKRSGGMCEDRLPNGTRCGEKAVDGHHIKPLSQGGANALHNLIHLCEHCHEKRHRHLARMGYAENRSGILADKRKRK